MKKLFETCQLGHLVLKNRLIRSATLERCGADQGAITPLLKTIYEDLARGEAGLIITGMMGVGPNACASPNMVKIYDDSFVAKFAEITRSVHQLGGKIMVQLGHSGAKAGVIDWGDKPFCPSDYRKAGAMTTDEINMMVRRYGDAAVKCKAAGADGVQIHGAHGYLVSEFLSPYFNHRTDQYGGEIHNRARFLFEIYEEIRAAVGEDYPVWMKINYSDLVENGLDGTGCAWVCRELEKRGLDAIEVSSGISVSAASSPTQMGQKKGEGFFAAGALDLADKVAIPVISVGGYRSIEAIEETLNRGNVAAISLCRPWIREPALAARWRAGRTEKAQCVSCDKCFSTAQHGCYFVKG